MYTNFQKKQKSAAVFSVKLYIPVAGGDGGCGGGDGGGREQEGVLLLEAKTQKRFERRKRINRAKEMENIKKV